MRAVTRKASLEKAQKKLEAIREKEKELIQKEKTLRLALETKRRREEKKARTHRLILIGEFIDKNADMFGTDGLEAMKYGISEIIDKCRKEILEAEDDKTIKKLERDIKNKNVLIDWIDEKIEKLNYHQPKAKGDADQPSNPRQ